MAAPEYSDYYADPRLAVLYDQLNPWGRSDDFYLGLVLAAESVLDVGCGTGVVLKQARERGHRGRLVGLDPAAAMLDQGRVRADVDWRLGDLGTVTFGREFDLIIMTGHVPHVFGTDAELGAAFTAIRAALADGGRYAFEAFNPAVRPWERWTGSVDVTGPDGAVVTVANVSPRVLDERTVEVTGKFSSPDWGADILCPSRFRFYDVRTLERLLSAAGLAIAHQYGWWDKRPCTAQAPEIITIATAS